MSRNRTTTALVIGLILLLRLQTAHSADRAEVVLGKKNVVSHGVGWGTAHPRFIDNGGVPSGRAFNLRWTGWGSPVSRARGLTWIYTPHGGYYGKPGALEFRAYRISRCLANGRPAYTRLQVRVALRPGGRLSRWFAWGGWRTICHGP